MVESVEGTFPEFSDIFLPWKRTVPNTEAVGQGNQTEKSRCGEGDGAEARHGLFWRRAPRNVPCDILVTGPRFLPCPSLVSATPSGAAASVGPLPCDPALSVCLLPTSSVWNKTRPPCNHTFTGYLPSGLISFPPLPWTFIIVYWLRGCHKTPSGWPGFQVLHMSFFFYQGTLSLLLSA